MLAATILSARALAPVELAIANWRVRRRAPELAAGCRDLLGAMPAGR